MIDGSTASGRSYRLGQLKACSGQYLPLLVPTNSAHRRVGAACHVQHSRGAAILWAALAGFCFIISIVRVRPVWSERHATGRAVLGCCVPSKAQMRRCGWTNNQSEGAGSGSAYGLRAAGRCAERTSTRIGTCISALQAA
jgi:hypothetical protein